MLRPLCMSLMAGVLFAAAAPVLASPHEVRVPLHQGKIRVADLSAGLLEELHVPTSRLPAGEIDLSGLGGSLFVSALNQSLGDGCRLEVSGDALVLHVDADNLPDNLDSVKLAVRTFTAVAAPQATAAQAARYGLHLPAKLDPARPLVVLVHGLDMGQDEWSPMAGLLDRSGYQVAYFGYPDDGPIADDSARLGKEFAGLRQRYPGLKVDVITFSMGSLVARGYVESPDYHGGVDRLILLAPPNHGSTWVGYRLLLEWKEHIELSLRDPQWSPTWMITDGLGEAGRDLQPDSVFLDHLNAASRQADVKYTIVAGTEHPIRRIAANCVAEAADLVPAKAANWWGLRQCRAGLSVLANDIRSETDNSDGPVKLESASLAGVSDVVRVHATHETIYQPDGDQPPAAWNVIKDRLGQ